MRAASLLFAILLISLLGAHGVTAQEAFRWEQSLDAAKVTAARTNRLVLVHFGAPWCAPCQALERDVFAQPGFGASLAGQFVAVKLNADHFPSTAREYGVEVLPSDVILTPQGQLVQRFSSPATAHEYVAALHQVAAVHRGPANQQVAQAAPQQPPWQQQAQAPANTMPQYTPPAQPTPSDDRYADYFNRHRQEPQPDLAGRYGDQAVAGAAPPTYQPPPAVHQPNVAARTTTPTIPPYQPQPDATVATNSPSIRPNPKTTFHPAGPPPVPSSNPTARVVQQQELPAGSAPLGLDGFCPVMLSTQQTWQPGDIRWGIMHRGRTYLFTSAESQQEFLSKPDAYSPVLSGNDPVLAVDQGQAVPGIREHGWFYDGSVYLFAGEATLQHFAQNPEAYAQRVRQMSP